MSAMKDAYHEQFGGSPKHDGVPELFEAGWYAASRVQRASTEEYEYATRIAHDGWEWILPAADEYQARAQAEGNPNASVVRRPVVPWEEA